MRVAYMGNLDSQIARTWIGEMQQRGVEPFALTSKQPSWDIPWTPITPQVPRIKGLGLGRRYLGAQVSKACADLTIDVLHSHEARGHVIWAQTSKFHPHVVSCWGSDVLRLEENSAEHRRRIHQALRQADSVTVGSRDLERAAIAAGARRDRCRLIGWGVDTSRYRRDDAGRSRIRHQWGLENRLVVASTRRHEPLYRIDAIIDAFAAARAADSRLALVIASYGSLSEQLRQQAERLGISDDVRFTGRLPDEGWPRIVDVLRGADAFCSVPETDGGPLSVLEAMACELPVVSRDIPVMQEWINEGVTGLLWSGNDVDVLAGLLVKAVCQREHMGPAARQYVRETHERANEMDKARALYDELALSGGSR